IDILYNMPYNEKNVITAKYYEGLNYSSNNPHSDDYYKLGNAYPKSPYLPENWWIFNVAIMYSSFMNFLGGWDCSFQACPMGHGDLAIRAQRAGAIVQLSSFPILNCDHMPGE